MVLHEKYFEERAVSSARSHILHPDLRVPKKKKAAPEREDVWEVYNERASRRCSLAEIKAQILMRGVPLGYAKTKEPLLKLWETNSALEDKRFVVQPARAPAAAGSGGGGAAAAVACSAPVAAGAGGSASIHAVSSGVPSVSAILPAVIASKRVCSKCKQPGHKANSTKCLQRPDNVSKTAAAKGGPRSPNACARGGGALSLSPDSTPVRRALAALGSTDQRVQQQQCAEK